MRPNNHVHTPLDGRSLYRQVLLNGKPIQQVVYADTRKGIVRYHEMPIRIHKYGKRALTKTMRGKVEIVINDPTIANPL